MTAAKWVSLEEVSICWKPSVPSKGHPSYVCVTTKEWNSDNVTNAAISMRWVAYSRDPWRCEQRPKPSPRVQGSPNGASEALNHLPCRVWVSPRGRVSTRQSKPRWPLDEVRHRAGNDLLHHFFIAGECKEVPKKGAKVPPVPAKYLPDKSVVLRNVGGDFGFRGVLN